MEQMLTRALPTEFTTEENSRKIHGLAIPVNVRSAFIRDHDGEYFEVILPSAVNEDLIANNDIKVFINHDMTQGTFARSKYGKGTLHLSVTERGLEFDFEAPDTVFGNALLEGIRRGDYDSVSFMFAPGKDKWTYDENGQALHIVESFAKLAEISILSLTPAFSVTEVELRSLENFKHEQEIRHQESIDKIDNVMDELNDLYHRYLNILY